MTVVTRGDVTEGGEEEGEEILGGRRVGGPIKVVQEVLADLKTIIRQALVITLGQ